MTGYVISAWLARHLVWGSMVVGAPSYCPDQTDEHGRSCVTAACDAVPARCTVTRVWGSPRDGYWVRLERSTTEDKP